jgi:hypothetical protein
MPPMSHRARAYLIGALAVGVIAWVASILILITMVMHNDRPYY